MTNTAMNALTNVTDIPGAVIHADVTQINVTSIGGARYFVTFIDDATGHITVNPIRKKNQASTSLINHVACVERQTGNKVKKVAMSGAINTYYAHAVNKLHEDGIVF